ncbi:hypothetical protein ABKV19_017133, partial [Rosa sericea]
LIPLLPPNYSHQARQSLDLATYRPNYREKKTKALDPLDLLSLSPLSILEPSRSSLSLRPRRRWRSRHSCCAGGTTSTSRLSGKTASSTLSAQLNPLGSSVALREIRVRIGARSSLIQTHLQFKASRPGDIDEREVVTPDVMTKYFIGVTLKERSPDGVGTLVDVGLSKNVVVDQVLDPGARVTVAMGDSWNLDADISRQVVSSSKPREEAGMYWGYKVHYASNITSVMIECPYKGGYDHLIGTSEHGQIINSSDLTIPTFRYLLIAFGGLAGLEESIEDDHNLKAKNVREVFDI